jgi:hypothetical protein
MAKSPPVKTMFRLATVDFRTSAIAGRGVFARRRFAPGDTIVAFAPKHRRLNARDPEATAAAEQKVTLLSDDQTVIVPDTNVPGGWLCNHSCNPNAAIFASGEGRIECTRPIAPGEEVTVFYGWVSHNEPERDPCRCGAETCRGTINFDLSDDDVRHVHVDEKNQVTLDDVLARRLAEYGTFLRSIGQEQVQEAIANTLIRMKLRKPGSVVCAY